MEACLHLLNALFLLDVFNRGNHAFRLKVALPTTHGGCGAADVSLPACAQ